MGAPSGVRGLTYLVVRKLMRPTPEKVVDAEVVVWSYSATALCVLVAALPLTEADWPAKPGQNSDVEACGRCAQCFMSLHAILPVPNLAS